MDKENNKGIQFLDDFEVIYETKITDALWVFYDIPGNIGWILYWVVMVLAFKNKPEYMNNNAIFTLMIVGFIPAILMLIGVVELISERILKLDRVLSKKRLYRGFGALFIGGVTGAIITIIVLIINIYNGYSVAEQHYIIELIIGSFLLIVFGGLLFKGYKKIK